MKITVFYRLYSILISYHDVCACVRAYVRTFVRACVRVCVCYTEEILSVGASYTIVEHHSLIGHPPNSYQPHDCH